MSSTPPSPSPVHVFTVNDYLHVHPSLRDPLSAWIAAHNLGTSPQRSLVGLGFTPGSHVFEARILTWPNEIDEVSGVWKTEHLFIEMKSEFPVKEW